MRRKRQFSRWMPPLPSPRSLIGKTLCFALAIFLYSIVLALTWPMLLIGRFVGHRHLRRLASERLGENIGTFARSFDRLNEPFDPWVIRATWDALGPYLDYGEGRVPIRISDRLSEDLRIDAEDIDFDLFDEVAERSGHSLEDLELNPFYGKVATVGDFVRFITLQPRVADRVA